MIRRFVIVAATALAATASGAQEVKSLIRKPMPMSLDQIQTLTDVIQRLAADYVRPVAGDEMLDQTLKGMLERIDPEGGEYFTRSEYDAFKQGLGGTGLPGIGVDMHRRNGALHLFPTEGSPAASAGIRSGDTLRSVDGTPVDELRPATVSALLRGPAGSRVTLGVVRASRPGLLSIVAERGLVPYPTVRLTRQDGDLVVLRVPSLQQRTLQQSAQALGDEWARKPYKGIVLDLRQNSGGLLESAVGMAAIFLQPDDVVVKTTGRIAQANQVLHATPADYLRGNEADPLAALPPALRRLPLVVLVDEVTASGAEIITGALHDHARAVVVGHATYGRGSVQTVMPLSSGGAMKITTAFYTTPSGAPIQGTGLSPDVAVDGDDEGKALQAALGALRKRL